ncbi:hypothetical protein MGYG_00075 [Nannizzia gypsea CBS 118893]|uniref:Uncharacterized protein n=1 Tax=Arthroderma gypseum (strain ATCC MYA-4604 / CBS 118893) TaxID=535722 RepID=E5R2P7_ARTGP|nr:hypothetical protein MGYG_00075 [Nannizzia gypsea CBS 118893]EFQ97031.1 hypothetical protein MGYG_00075 [Nannizzia gypsea CBS 118893]
MEPTSSRDTVPMSSTTLNRVRRTLTAPGPYAPQSSAHSMDELALPFPFEVAVPRYPLPHLTPATTTGSITAAAPSSYVDTGSLWEVPDDQLEQEATGCQLISTVENIPEENHEPGAVVEDPELDVDPISTIEEVPRSYMSIKFGRETVPVVDPAPEPVIDAEETSQDQDDIAQRDENVNSVEPADILTQPENSLPQPQTVSGMEPKEHSLKRVNKSRKKKVKRGKTTSAVVRRMVESDIEDDVIWIDEKKSRPAIIDDTDASDDILDLNENDNLFATNGPTHETNSTTEGVPRIEVQVQVPTTAVDKPNGYVGLAQKKRGRKRKKTGQEDVSMQQIETLIPDDPCGNHKYNIPSASLQPSSSPDIVKQQTPEPKVDHHDLHTSVETPRSPVDKRAEPIPSTETPKKPALKGADKHSPIAVTAKVAYRVGLSRKARIAPLLKVVRK